MVRIWIVILIMLLVLSCSGGTVTATAFSPTTIVEDNYYFVSVSGDDHNPGTQTLPWRTIQKAANMVKAGNIVTVLNGTYAEHVVINHSGVDEFPITFQALGRVVMRGFTILANYNTIHGFEITDTEDNSTSGWGVFASASNCVIENNYIHYATRGGILLFPQPGRDTLVENCIVRNNRLYRNALVGIEVHGRNHLIENNEIWGTIQHHPNWANQPSWVDADGIRFFGTGHNIRKNYIHDILYGTSENINPHIDCFQTWQDGSDRESASNIVIEQNLCLNLQGGVSPGSVQGFMIKGAKNLTIRNNLVRAYRVLNAVNCTFLTIVNNTFTNKLGLSTDYYPGIIVLANTPNSVIQNNVFYDPLMQSIFFHDDISKQGVSISYNNTYRSDGGIPLGKPNPNDLWMVDPLFADARNGNFHMQTGSPLIDNGLSLPNVQNDYDGNSRPQLNGFDIGAFEYIPGK